MKLSILDKAPVFPGYTAHEALQASGELAKLADKWGYSRYWMAEHHDMRNIACSAPETMLGFLGAVTDNIRIGSGAVLLPHYQPYKVAEIYNLLAVLFPGRIDIGIGRAPGGSPEASIALSGNFLENVKKMPEKVTELLHFIREDFPENSFFADTKATPLPDHPPIPWTLGTSEKSAELAAKNGTGYVFGQFMSDKDGAAAVNQYRNLFEPGPEFSSPYTVLTVNALCAATQEKAEEIAYSVMLNKVLAEKQLVNDNVVLNEEDEQKVQNLIKKVVVGTPDLVKNKLEELQSSFQADEVMVVTYTNDFQQRTESYRLMYEHILKEDNQQL
ncbi:LLM class flavin-dependent oxidoreductase [Sediminibacillus halophilus]|uniref:Luciferase family oxidoreductase, group 1 n=1 Tax=Sediminibacillus halophilus TaxID=482461 RepID=A0A1G9M6J4_9BACI|nr:LLM class flavin-dependent oxidoreductase [Sediminibacillus halophilus]SDL69754.1 luciferase family oxidoreductase, group 1 [Sediminibacillus halophilus]